MDFCSFVFIMNDAKSALLFKALYCVVLLQGDAGGRGPRGQQGSPGERVSGS